MQSNELKRLKYVAISTDLLKTLLHNGFNIRRNTLSTYSSDFPEDAELLEVKYDFPKDIILLKCWHPSFPIVEDGQVVPELLVKMTTHEFKLADELS